MGNSSKKGKGEMDGLVCEHPGRGSLVPKPFRSGQAVI
jgi:hypothetical protein